MVNLQEQLAAFGLDAVRVAMVFAGPPKEDINWADVSPDRLGQMADPGTAARRRT